ncbi:hypothetical protein RJT34_30631 [Clitoria ternatea]|uniref:SCP domain-containing protein n=1 Tax=Clitoria ternatea TaxID=43366 RepID=A0AAN9I260_CLITE
MVQCALLVLVAVAAVGSIHVTAGAAEATPPAVALPAAAREFLEAHNGARAAVGVEPMKWSEQVASISSKYVRLQRDKMGCQFANLTAGKFGANQLWARGTLVTPRMVVDHWVKEKPFYNHTDNSCAPNHKCGVYTQVVWRSSLQLGCAQATCVQDQASLTICFYDPPGNYVGEKPY